MKTKTKSLAADLPVKLAVGAFALCGALACGNAKSASSVKTGTVTPDVASNAFMEKLGSLSGSSIDTYAVCGTLTLVSIDSDGNTTDTSTSNTCTGTVNPVACTAGSDDEIRATLTNAQFVDPSSGATLSQTSGATVQSFSCTADADNPISIEIDLGNSSIDGTTGQGDFTFTASADPFETDSKFAEGTDCDGGTAINYVAVTPPAAVDRPRAASVEFPAVIALNANIFDSNSGASFQLTDQQTQMSDQPLVGYLSLNLDNRQLGTGSTQYLPVTATIGSTPLTSTQTLNVGLGAFVFDSDAQYLAQQAFTDSSTPTQYSYEARTAVTMQALRIQSSPATFSPSNNDGQCVPPDQAEAVDSVSATLSDDEILIGNIEADGVTYDPADPTLSSDTQQLTIDTYRNQDGITTVQEDAYSANSTHVGDVAFQEFALTDPSSNGGLTGDDIDDLVPTLFPTAIFELETSRNGKIDGGGFVFNQSCQAPQSILLTNSAGTAEVISFDFNGPDSNTGANDLFEVLSTNTDQPSIDSCLQGNRPRAIHVAMRR